MGSVRSRLKAEISGASADTIVQWDFSDPADTGAQSAAQSIGSGSGTCEATHSYLPGSYQARLVVVQPADCDAHPLDIGPLSSCEKVCPAITPKIGGIGDCDASGRRLVTVGVTVSGAASSALLQVDYGDGTFSENLEVTGNQSRSFAAHPYPPPGPYHATVNVVHPAGCAGAMFDIPELLPCSSGTGSTDPTPTIPTTTTTTTTPPRPQSSLCRALEFNWMFWLFVGIICAILALCAATEGTAIAAIAAAVTEGIGGSIEVIVGFVTLFFLLVAIGAIAAALVCFVLWLVFCRPSDCRVWEDFLWVIGWAMFVSGFLSFVCPHIALPVFAALAVANSIAQDYVASHGCTLQRPLSVPWRRN